MAEAQRVLRLGRTKMYALAAEWRHTGGASGLRVVDFGGALRVPRLAVEEIVGGPIHLPPPQEQPEVEEPAVPAAPPLGLVSGTDDTPANAASQRPSRSSRRRPSDQLDLFDPPAAS